MNPFARIIFAIYLLYVAWLVAWFTYQVVRK